MNELVKNFTFFWDYKISPHWSLIIPLLLVLIALIWLATIYRKGGFRFLPALAIARVTVLDSIGRLEVIILLAIGMLIVGMQGILPNTALGRSEIQKYENIPYFRERLDDISGVESFIPHDDDYIFSTSVGGADGEDLQLSIVDGEVVQTSVVGDEGSVISPDRDDEIDGAGTSSDDDAGGGDNEGEGGSTTDESGGEGGDVDVAVELADVTRESTLSALIWQAAFLVADFFVALIGFVLAMVVLPNEMNRGVTLSILPKPLTRDEYIFGKALGIWLIVSGCFLIFAIELLGVRLVFNIMSGNPAIDWRLFEAMLLFPFKYATLILIIMGLTLRMPEVPAGIVGVTFYMAGHFVDRIYEIAMNSDTLLFKYSLKFSYWILPHLSQVTVIILDRDMTLINDWGDGWGWIWQVVIYNTILLWLLCWLFRRRSL